VSWQATLADIEEAAQDKRITPSQHQGLRQQLRQQAQERATQWRQTARGHDAVMGGEGLDPTNHDDRLAANASPSDLFKRD